MKHYFYIKHKNERPYMVFVSEGETHSDAEEKARTVADMLDIKFAGGYFSEETNKSDLSDYVVIVVPESTEPTPAPRMLVDKMLDYENGDLNKEDTVDLFQELVNSGIAWTLQGHYGRAAEVMIEAGIITSKENV